jgi:transglutaminase-like putative cysteine protease
MTERGRAPAGTVLAFGLLAAYGALRWATMLGAPPAGRLAGLVVLACLIAALGDGLRAQDGRVRAASATVIALAALAMIPLAGIPLGWVADVRIAATARAIREGLSQLPGVLVPYRGSDPWTRAVIVLGAGLLMLGGALTLATAGQAGVGRRSVGEARLAGAALPLIVLAAVPSALASPRFVWLHGLATFTLLALFILRERIPRGRAVGATLLIAVAAGAALLAGPALAGRRPWISVTQLASRLGSSTERFSWRQTYGRLDWPRSGDTVLSVHAQFGSYWKAENLDVFNGRAWVEGAVGLPTGIGAVAPVNLDRWTQRLTITLGSISTRQVIVAGTAQPPALGGATARPAPSPGTFVSDRPLGQGVRYRVLAYTPLPDAAELAAAGTRYPLPAIAPELTMELPGRRGRPGLAIEFGSYASDVQLVPFDGRTTAQEQTLLDDSPYRRAWLLAQRLAAPTATPYAYVEAVRRYLVRHLRYDESPPPARYPLLSFLFGARRGYCQQFAGAMALLLRMGGVPARVATGFTTGAPSRRPGTYEVSDLDAHSWVEAWFPAYGWVELEATPAADPALGGGSALPASLTGLSGTRAVAAARVQSRGHSAGAATAGRHPQSRRSQQGSGVPWQLGAVAVLLLVAALLAVAVLRRRPAPSAEQRLRELERALARCGELRGPAVTLATLERRFADRPAAAAYIAAIRDARFAPRAAEATDGGRSALRSALAHGRGLSGRLRALIALPPAPRRRA